VPSASGDTTITMDTTAVDPSRLAEYARRLRQVIESHGLTAGFYGHADHITCSEIITELKKTRFQEVPLWYVTFPKRVLARVKPPEHMATDPHVQEKRTSPTHKIFIGVSVFPKIKSWYTYKSQRASFTKGLSKLLPLWFFLSMLLFEYFAEVS